MRYSSQAFLNVFPCVVLRLPVVPDLINNRLPVLFLNDYFREIFDKNAELLECHPCNIVVDGFQKELLKASAFRCLNLVAEIRKDQVRHPPQREVAGVILPVTGDVVIGFPDRIQNART